MRPGGRPRRTSEVTDEQGQALREAQGKAEKLAAELVAARQETEAQTAAARAASDEARRAVETNKRSADEQGQALREAQGKAEKLAAELVAARQEVEADSGGAGEANCFSATRVSSASNRWLSSGSGSPGSRATVNFHTPNTPATLQVFSMAATVAL